MIEMANWAWPQYVLLIIWLLGIAVHFANDGKPMDQKYSGVGRSIHIAITFLLLMAGGFWQ